MSNRMSGVRAAAAACLLGLAAAAATAQSRAISYNDLYKFLVSVGVEYSTLSPMSDYGTEITSYYGISGVVRVPLTKLPSLQPLLRLGMAQLVAPARDNQDKFSHTDWYGLVGAAWMDRFNKNFEIGGEAGVGFGEGIFPLLDITGITRGSPNLLAMAGLHVGFDPAFNTNIDVFPHIRYAYSFTPLTNFNGFAFGIGITGHYRFGEDPDAPQAVVRDLKLDGLKCDPVFAAMQAVYTRRPFATARLTNTGRYPLTDIQLSFQQPGYMDSPTVISFPQDLAPGESAPVEIKATFNGQVFTTQGVMPLTGQLTAEYSSRGKTAKQTFSVQYDLQDKNAIAWNDDRKVAAFITPRDSALGNYTSFVVRTAKDEVRAGLSNNLQLAVQLFCALKEIGLVYKTDPTSSFTQMKGNPELIDTVGLPRDTLKLGAGDCDDLTALYCATLETLGVPTGFVTVPGHIYPMFDTGVGAKDYAHVHPDAAMTIALGGTLWVPVEITTVKDGDFLGAWRLGIDQFHALDSTPDKRGVYRTAECQAEYPPVGLLEKDLGLQYGSATAIIEGVRTTRERIIDLIVGSYDSAAAKTRSKRDLNKLGMICAQFGRYPAAQKALTDALAIDRNSPEPLVNLANVYYLKGEYQNALRSYIQAEDLLVELGRGDSQLSARVLLNIALAYNELENFDKAAEYFDKATKIDPGLRETHASLAASGTARGASVSTIQQPLYADVE